MHEPPNYDSDTTPVRAGEELNLVWLEEHLRSRLPEECLPEPERTRAPIGVRQFPGGHSNLTYLIRFGSRELVLRRPPFGPVAPTAHDMPREFRVLSLVHPVFTRGPRHYVNRADPRTRGQPSVVMEA